MQPLIPWFEVPIFQLGPLELHGFGILVALGFVVGGSVAIRRADQMGLQGEAINRLITWLVIGTFIGGHVGFGIMYQPVEYFGNLPTQFGEWFQSIGEHGLNVFEWKVPLILAFWKGLSSFGGFLVCIPLAIVFFRRENLPVWSYLDCLAVGMSVGWFLGRMGCFVAHDHPGSETDFFLGVWCWPEAGHVLDLPAFMTGGVDATPQPWGPCRELGKSMAVHDTGLYEGLWSLAMFGIFTYMDRQAWKPGTFVLSLGLAYGPTRFFLDSFRPISSDPKYAGLTPAQWLSLVLTAVCLAALYWRFQSEDDPVGPPNPDLTAPKPEEGEGAASS